ncbi:MAG: beta-lactamase family protein [Verrucomicrobiales bacterium]|nr:beta-lactamase family protein [Verrucomicrobiales bacterium]
MHSQVFLAALFLVAACRAIAAGLPVSRPHAEGMNSERLQRVFELVDGTVKAGQHAGANVLVLRHGRIVGQRSFGSRDVETGAPMRADTIVRIYSMSKVVTAVAVLQLFEENRFALDAPVARWLPELKDLKVFESGTAAAPNCVPTTRAITVRMLLNHTGGFTYDFFSGSPVHELYQQADLWNSTSLDEFMAKVGKLPLLAQPGTAYNYSISDDILGALIQRVSGMTFEEFVARRITGPLRMSDTFFDVPADKLDRLAKIHELRDGRLHTKPEILGAYAERGRGIPCGGAGLFSTIGDYARFAQCLMNGGELDGARILGRKTVELALMNSLPPGVHAFNAADGWGLFSAVRLDPVAAGEPLSAGSFYWSGAATTHFFCDPKEQVLALVFCQHLPFDQHQLFGRFRTSVMQAVE